MYTLYIIVYKVYDGIDKKSGTLILYCLEKGIIFLAWNMLFNIIVR
ncbi:hypothetical protein ACSVC9_01005 [Clostridium sp. LBM24168]